MSQPTQNNLKLQLDLAELVQSKDLPMWESKYFISVNDAGIFYLLNCKAKNGLFLDKLAIDLNQNCFGDWLDKIFGNKDWYDRESHIIGEYTATLAKYLKIEIALNGLTDEILEELIKEIKKL